MKKKNPKTRPNQKNRRKTRFLNKVEDTIARFVASLPIQRQGEDPQRVMIRVIRRAMRKHLQTSLEWQRLKVQLDRAYENIPAKARAR